MLVVQVAVAAAVAAAIAVTVWRVVAVVASKDVLPRSAVPRSVLPRSVVLRSADPEEVGVKPFISFKNQ